jgi:hypothetical protein
MTPLVLGPSYALLESAVPGRMRAWVQRHEYQINNLINAAWLRTDDYARDIPFSAAVTAFSGTSHVPETRAYRAIYDYAQHLHAVRDDLIEAAKGDPERIEAAEAAFATYRDGYRTRFRAWLTSRGGLVSSMIAGPARFPVAQQQKKGASVDRRWDELTEWSERAIKAALREITAVNAPPSDPVSDLERRIATRKQAQEAYKATNAILRKKISDEEKVAAIVALGISEDTARKALVPDFAGRIGFPAYVTQNNLAEIKRLEARLAAERKKSAVIEAVEAEDSAVAGDYAFAGKDGGPGGTVVYNVPMDRVQIVYDVERVPRDLYDTLRRYGFVYSPREKAFQRRLNAQGVRAASIVTGLNLPWSGV